MGLLHPTCQHYRYRNLLLLRLFNQVVIYYLKEYAQQIETMWDNFLIPLLEGGIPVLIF